MGRFVRAVIEHVKTSDCDLCRVIRHVPVPALAVVGVLYILGCCNDGARRPP